MSSSNSDADSTRLLSIQSHVVTGHVGNRSATFPLQLLGWDVDVVNTTQLSNHTGYGRWGGMRMDAEHLQSVFEGLEMNGLVRHARLLTGYTPTPAALAVVTAFIARMRAHKPELVYLLDPVLGDTDRGFYVDKECLPLYRELLPHAQIVCPNSFEAQQLAGIEITSKATLLQVLRTLHTQYAVPHVIITSLDPLPSDLGIPATLPSGAPAMLQVGSSFAPLGDAPFAPWTIQFAEVQGHFVGVGDLFSALTLGRFRPGEAGDSLTPLARAAELAIAGVAGVLAKTTEAAAQAPPLRTREQVKAALGEAADEKEVDAQMRIELFKGRELRIVQGREAIERPEVVHRAVRLEL